MSSEMQQRPNMLPALQGFAGQLRNDDLSSAIETFPVLSIRGGRWSLKKDGARSVLQRDGQPIQRLVTVLLAANRVDSRAYYAGSYDQEATDAPDCASLDGITPDPGVSMPQATSCMGCPQNEIGSRIIEGSGKRAKACSTVRNLCFLVGGIPEPVLLRAPYNSIKQLVQYRRKLDELQVPYFAVKTFLSFDMETSYPLVHFDFGGYLSEKEQAVVAKHLQTGAPQDMVGLTRLANREPASPPAAPQPEPAPVEDVAEELPQEHVEIDTSDIDAELAGVGDVQAEEEVVGSDGGVELDAEPQSEPAEAKAAPAKPRKRSKKNGAKESVQAAEKPAEDSKEQREFDLEGSFDDLLKDLGI